MSETDDGRRCIQPQRTMGQPAVRSPGSPHAASGRAAYNADDILVASCDRVLEGRPRGEPHRCRQAAQ